MSYGCGQSHHLAVGQVLRASDWVTAWNLQKKILAEAPISDLKRTEPDAQIVILNPLDVNGAPIFAATWDINLKTAVERTSRGHEADSLGFPTAPHFTVRARTRFLPTACDTEVGFRMGRQLPFLGSITRFRGLTRFLVPAADLLCITRGTAG